MLCDQRVQGALPSAAGCECSPLWALAKDENKTLQSWKKLLRLCSCIAVCRRQTQQLDLPVPVHSWILLLTHIGSFTMMYGTQLCR